VGKASPQAVEWAAARPRIVADQRGAVSVAVQLPPATAADTTLEPDCKRPVGDGAPSAIATDDDEAMADQPTDLPPRQPDLGDLPRQPDARGPIGGDAGAREGPISERVGRNPGNLGDEPPTATDTTHPSPEPSDLQM
jgi:hypothetical protein